MEAITRRAGDSVIKKKVNPVLTESDPLFGVLEESQVGINPNTGRPRIAPEVLDGMRQYLCMAKGEERIIREERVKSSVREVEKDPVLMKSALSLEPLLVVTKNLEKGKGIVFGYEPEGVSNRLNAPHSQGEKLMASAIRASPLIGWMPVYPSSDASQFDVLLNLLIPHLL